MFSCSRASITLIYTLSNIVFSSEEIFPNTCEIVLKFFPFSRGGEPIPILILLKFCVCNCSMMLLSPLCPPLKSDLNLFCTNQLLLVQHHHCYS